VCRSAKEKDGDETARTARRGCVVQRGQGGSLKLLTLIHTVKSKPDRHPLAKLPLRAKVLSMLAEFKKQLSQTLEEIKSQGTLQNRADHYHAARCAHRPSSAATRLICARTIISASRSSRIDQSGGRKRSTVTGSGMASVRLICGTQDLHKDSRLALTKFSGRKRQSFIRAHSTPTRLVRKHYSPKKTPSSVDELNQRVDHRRHPALLKAQRFRYKHKRHG